MSYIQAGKYNVNEVVLHCAALNKAQIEQFSKWSAAQCMAEIDRWHKSRKPPFKKFGYHGLFMPNGQFLQGRQFTEIGAHVVERNKGSIGFLMIESQEILKIGRFEDFFTEMQRKAVRQKIKELPGIKWVTGHNDYANKLCPGFKVKDEDWLP